MMHENNVSTLISPDDENSSLFEIINFLLYGWKWLLGGIVAGALFGLACTFFIQPVYEASASIQVAKVATVPVETPQFLIEKLKLPLFYSEHTLASCSVSGYSQPGLALSSMLKVSVSKETSIIQLKFQDSDPQKASVCLLAVVNDIKTQQKLLSIPLINKIKVQISQLEYRLSELLKAKSMYETFLLKSKPEAVPTPISSLILSASYSHFGDIATLQGNIDSLKNLLELPDTQEAGLILPIYVPNDKISPNHLLWGVAGGLIGIVLGAFSLVARTIVRRKKQF